MSNDRSNTPSSLALDALKYALKIAEAEEWNLGEQHFKDGYAENKLPVGLIAVKKMRAAIDALSSASETAPFFPHLECEIEGGCQYRNNQCGEIGRCLESPRSTVQSATPARSTYPWGAQFKVPVATEAQKLADKIEAIQDDGGEGVPWSQDELDLMVSALRSTAPLIAALDKIQAMEWPAGDAWAGSRKASAMWEIADKATRDYYARSDSAGEQGNQMNRDCGTVLVGEAEYQELLADAERYRWLRVRGAAIDGTDQQRDGLVRRCINLDEQIDDLRSSTEAKK